MAKFRIGNVGGKPPVTVTLGMESGDTGGVNIYLDGDLVAVLVDDRLQLHGCKHDDVRERHPELFAENYHLKVSYVDSERLLN